MNIAQNSLGYAARLFDWRRGNFFQLFGVTKNKVLLQWREKLDELYRLLAEDDTDFRASTHCPREVVAFVVAGARVLVRNQVSRNPRLGRSVVGRQLQSVQTPGKSGGAAAGTVALTSASAACNAASLVWSREVFSTVPPSPLSLSRTLSAVTLRTSTKSAAVPG